jgi:nicotinic acid mononucleotide adenylyltransferase
VPIAMTPVDCSSTQIRALLRSVSPQAASTVQALLPPGVLDYIRHHRLYS